MEELISCVKYVLDLHGIEISESTIKEHVCEWVQLVGILIEPAASVKD